ncbi:MAG: Rieske (2Fe-2S) protein [Actinomycetes bacterium]
MAEQRVGTVSELPAGTIKGVGHYAVGNADGEYFAVTRRCRHFRADLAGGTIDENGCLVCPWHQSAYDVSTGRMARGPQGVFAKIPGLGASFRLLTRVVPLGRKNVERRGDDLYLT